MSSSSADRSAGHAGAAPADGELLRRIGEGDAGAIGALYDCYAAILFPIALRILRDRAEAEDIVHDAFVTVADRASQYTAERGTVSAWLVTLVRNLSIDWTRRRERRGALARDVVAHEPVTPVQAPDALVIDAAERAKIGARSRLSPKRSGRRWRSPSSRGSATPRSPRARVSPSAR